MALTVLNAIVVGLLAVSYVSGTDDEDKETLRRELIDTACSFKENATAKQDFFRTVRTKHGVDESEEYGKRFLVEPYRNITDGWQPHSRKAAPTELRSAHTNVYTGTL